MINSSKYLEHFFLTGFAITFWTLLQILFIIIDFIKLQGLWMGISSARWSMGQESPSSLPGSSTEICTQTLGVA